MGCGGRDRVWGHKENVPFLVPHPPEFLVACGGGGEEVCPSAWSSLAQGQGLRAGAGEGPWQRGAVFEKSPLSAQALFLLLSKSLAFLEVRMSAAEPVRPVCALRNQARAKLEGTDALGTCWPT